MKEKIVNIKLREKEKEILINELVDSLIKIEKEVHDIEEKNLNNKLTNEILKECDEKKFRAYQIKKILIRIETSSWFDTKKEVE